MGALAPDLSEHSDTIPKPLVNIGYRPLLWHLMRYYAHYGHKEFILCLGYRGDLIREYFLRYEEAMTNDFTLHTRERRVELHSRDLDEWKITFVDTGLHANIGQRLLRVRKYVENEPSFLANYSDGLSDMPLDRQIREFEQGSAVASLQRYAAARAFMRYKRTRTALSRILGAMAAQHLRINGGYFVMRPTIFDYIHEGEELVEQPFERLFSERD